jgi:hypothetical protein
MERVGVRVDAAALRQQSGELAKRLWELEQQAHELAGERFNLGSPKQLQSILFERLQLPAGKKTPTGQSLHCRRRLAGTGAGLSVATGHFGTPDAEQAEIHLYRPIAGADSSPHRAGAYFLSSSGGQHRPAVLIRSEFAEHPHAHPGGAAHSSGVYCGTGLFNAWRRIIRRSNCESWPICPAMKGCYGPLLRARMSTGRQPPKCLALRRTRSEHRTAAQR